MRDDDDKLLNKQGLIMSIDEDLNSFLEETNSNGVMTRPVWQLMNELEIYGDAQCGSLKNSKWLAERIVNIPSGVK